MNLGLVLRDQGRFEESRQAFLEVATHRLAWRKDANEMALRSEYALELERRLPDILNGKAQPANPAEAFLFGDVLRWKGRNADAAAQYAKAFADNPRLANDPSRSTRFAAARAAALAATGRHGSGTVPTDAERTRLLGQARRWLMEEMDELKRLRDTRAPAALVARRVAACRVWASHTDLAAVRDAAALAELPEAERVEWQRFWHDLDALLGRTDGPN